MPDRTHPPEDLQERLFNAIRDAGCEVDMNALRAVINVIRPELDRLTATTVQPLTVAPGQTLVLISGSTISTTKAVDLKQRAMAKLPGVDVVVFAGIDQALVYDPDDH